MNSLHKTCKNCQKNYKYSSGKRNVCKPCIDSGFKVPRVRSKEQTIIQREKAKIRFKSKMENPSFKNEFNRKRREYVKKNRDRINARSRAWKNSNPHIKLSVCLRIRLSIFLRQNKIFKSKGFNEYIGCSPQELRTYLESKFQPGMSWENHGNKGWHVDHITPLCSAKNSDEVYKLCHYTNLQPLWATENLRKNGKLIY